MCIGDVPAGRPRPYVAGDYTATATGVDECFIATVDRGCGGELAHFDRASHGRLTRRNIDSALPLVTVYFAVSHYLTLTPNPKPNPNPNPNP